MTKFCQSSALAIALVLVTASASHAVSTLTTALVFRSARTFECAVVNTASKAATVTLQAVNAIGAPEGELVNQLIPPGHASIVAVPPSTGSPYLYCKFTLTVGKKAALRGSYCVHVDEVGTRCGASGDAR